jgi:hypothetical protein
MNQSIERMWKEGFTNTDAIVIPKINDLYNKKSNLIIDKIERMYRTNIKLLYWLAAFFILACSSYGAPFLGIYIACLLGFVIIEGKKQIKKFEKVDHGANCYQYLVTVNQWFNNLYAHFENVYRYFYPLFFAGLFCQFIFSGLNTKLSQNILEIYPNTQTLYGSPYWFYLIGILGTGFFYIIGGSIGKFDLDLIYKKVGIKLEKLIVEMDELRRKE